MSNLKDLVKYTVLYFIDNDYLFTALDITNTVRERLPQARHREVKDIVKKLFVTDMEPVGYAKTPIDVKLSNGTSTTMLLYHQLSDSWDLDSKYDFGKRSYSIHASSKSDENKSTDRTPLQIWESLFKTTPSFFPRK